MLNDFLSHRYDACIEDGNSEEGTIAAADDRKANWSKASVKIRPSGKAGANAGLLGPGPDKMTRNFTSTRVGPPGGAGVAAGLPAGAGVAAGPLKLGPHGCSGHSMCQAAS